MEESNLLKKEKVMDLMEEGNHLNEEKLLVEENIHHKEENPLKGSRNLNLEECIEDEVSSKLPQKRYFRQRSFMIHV